MRKVEWKMHLNPALAERVQDAWKTYQKAGRRVSRNAVVEQLLEDGFRMWERDNQVVTRVEGSISKLVDQTTRHSKILDTILLNLADGDVDEVKRLKQIIEKGDEHG